MKSDLKIRLADFRICRVLIGNFLPVQAAVRTVAASVSEQKAWLVLELNPACFAIHLMFKASGVTLGS